MQTRKLIIIGIVLSLLLSGCSNQTAARVGNRIGIILGKPIGVIATTADQAVRTTGKIVAENVREQREHRQQQTEQSIAAAEKLEPETNQQTPAANSQSPNPPELSSQQQPKPTPDSWQQN